MLPPIRCFSCNALMKWREFEELREKRVSKKEAMDRLGAQRYCCRRMMTGIQEGLLDILVRQQSTGFVNGFTRLQLGLDSTTSATSASSDSLSLEETGCTSMERVIKL